MGTRRPGANEQYCQSCGSIIKREAVICPECGVQNGSQPQRQAATTGERVYCSSCGESIRAQAEICPNCNVRTHQGSRGAHTSTGDIVDETLNEVEDVVSAVKNRQADKKPHDPTDYRTTTSDRWHYGVALSIGLWVLAFMISAATPTAESANPVLGLIGLVAWVGVPLCTYFDIQYVRSESFWSPETLFWVGLSILPIINFISGPAYLHKRQEALRDAKGEVTAAGQAPLDELRRDYSEGRIDEAELEQRAEELVADEKQ